MKGYKQKLLKLNMDRRAHLNEWLRRESEAQKQVPSAQELLRLAEWDEKVLNNLPDSEDKSIPPDLLDNYSQRNVLIKQTYQLPHVAEEINTGGTVSTSTSDSSTIYTFVRSFGTFVEGTNPGWLEKFTVDYENIQDEFDRYGKVKDSFSRLSPGLAIELEIAKNAYSQAKSELSDRSAAGIAMRNVLEHYKGELQEMARRISRGKMPWSRMTELLCTFPEGSAQYATLLKQEEDWGALHLKLTDLAKRQKNCYLIDLQDIWVKFIDHLFIVFGLIKL